MELQVFQTALPCPTAHSELFARALQIHLKAVAIVTVAHLSSHTPCHGLGHT